MAAEIVRVNTSVQRDTPRIGQYVQIVDLNTVPGTAVTFTVPDGVNHIVVKYNAGVLRQNSSGTTAAAPAAAVTNGTGSEMVFNGEGFSVSPAQQISLHNAMACWVEVVCRKVVIS